MKISGWMKAVLLLMMTMSLTGCVGAMKIKYNADVTPHSEDFRGSRVTVYAINPEAIEASRKQAVRHFPAELLAEGNTPYVYRLGVGDVVAVTVWEHPELTQPLGQYRSDALTGQLIDADGTMFYPYIGKIQASGLTPEEVRRVITEKLSKTLENPQVDVKVLSYRSKKVYVGGQVMQPGGKPITDDPMTLPEAISQAGGFTPLANGGDLWLTRGEKTYTIDYLSIYREGAPLDKIRLRPGDKLHVPSRDENKVYVLGEVPKPQGVPMQQGHLSLTQALGEVGGVFETTANADAIYVVRGDESGKGVAVYHLSAKNPVALVLADQFELKARDVIYVDNTGLAGWSRFMSLILPTAQLLNATTNIADDVNGL